MKVSLIAALSLILITSTARAVSNDDIAGAKTRAAQAQAQHDAAVSQLSLFVDSLKQQYQGTPEYITAKGNFDAAQQAYEANRVRVINSLHGSPDYLAALSVKQDAEKAVSEARASGSTDLMELAQTSLDARSALTRMENSALSNDADYVTSHSAMVVAAAVLKKLDAAFEIVKASSAEYRADRTAVDRAQAAVAAADGEESSLVTMKNVQDAQAQAAMYANQPQQQTSAHVHIP